MEFPFLITNYFAGTPPRDLNDCAAAFAYW
jgi:hypothetical protein